MKNWIGKYQILIEIVFWCGLFLGYLIYLGQFWPLYGRVPLSDPLGYPQLARVSRFFYDSGSREPLYIFLVKLALLVIADESLALRLLTVLSTLGATMVMTMWVRYRWGFAAGIGVILAMMVNHISGYYSCQGYNMNAYSLALVVFFGFWSGSNLTWRGRDWMLGLLVAVMALIRLEGLLVGIICLMADIVLIKKRPMDILKSFLVMASFVVPYLAVNKFLYGEYLFSHWGHAVYWADRTESLGAGYEQFFSSVVQWCHGFVLGWTWYLWRLWQGAEWVLALALLGVVVVKKIDRWRFLVFIAAMLFPVAWILPLDQVAPGSGVELRFVLPLAWPVAALAGLGISGVGMIFLWRKNFRLMW